MRQLGYFALSYLVGVPMLKHGTSMDHNAPKDASWNLRLVHMMVHIGDDCVPTPKSVFAMCMCASPKVGGFQGGHGKVELLFGAMRALCRNTPYVWGAFRDQKAPHNQSVVIIACGRRNRLGG